MASADRQVAWGHTILTCQYVALLALCDPFVKLVNRLVPGEEDIIEAGPKYLDRNMPRLLPWPWARRKGEIKHGGLESGMIDDAMRMLTKNEISILKTIERNKDVIDELKRTFPYI